MKQKQYIGNLGMDPKQIQNITFDLVKKQTLKVASDFFFCIVQKYKFFCVCGNARNPNVKYCFSCQINKQKVV